MVDLEAAIPYEAHSQYWADALHLTEKGYDKLAELIFSEAKELFQM